MSLGTGSGSRSTWTSGPAPPCKSTAPPTTFHGLQQLATAAEQVEKNLSAYRINDADNHFNEPLDCFERYIENLLESDGHAGHFGDPMWRVEPRGTRRLAVMTATREAPQICASGGPAA